MKKIVLYIDGENLRHYIETVLFAEGIKKEKINITKINFSKLFGNALKNIKIDKKNFYAAKLHEYPEYPDLKKTSKELILRQRVLKTNLEKQGFAFVLTGNVRAQEININGKKKIIFKEKGVDVKIAIDMVSNVCDKLVDTAIICSSDSDLQPAIKEIRNRGTKVIYVGFEINPNKGLTYTTNRTILLRNSEVLESLLH